MRLKKLPNLFVIALIFLSCQQTNEQLLDKAYMMAEKGRTKEAIEIYGKIIKRNDKIQLAYYNRALCYVDLKEYSRACNDFSKVISLQTAGNVIITVNPNMPYASEDVRNQVPWLDALYNRAIAKYHMDSIKSSYRDFQTCIDNNYEVRNCTLWQGTLLYRTGKKERGCEIFLPAYHSAANMSSFLL